MEKKRVPIWVGIVGVIIIIGSLIWNVYELLNMISLKNPDVIAFAVLAGLLILGLVSALVYFFAGYKKDAAKYFKAFAYIYVLANFEICMFMDVLPLASRFCTVLTLCVLCVLATGLDLGKKKSNILCAINMVGTLANLIICGMTYAFNSRSVSTTLLAIITWIMVAGKYADKEARGSK